MRRAWRVIRSPLSVPAIVLAMALPLCAQNVTPGTPIDPPFVIATVNALADVINKEYFDPDAAARVAATLRQSLAEHRYEPAASAESLATILSRDLYAATHDKHLAVEVVRDPPAAQRPPSPDETRALVARRSNSGVRRVEILAGNVGYLDVSSFFRLEEARDAIADAMRLLRGADALIVDMRANGGGSPGTVAFLMGYFFDEAGLPLFEIVHRPPEPPDRYTTEPARPVEHDGRRPMYVLTSAHTFSAGEGFAFLLQERRRADVIGETTAGAANPGRSYPVNARFSVTVPNGRVRSAIRGGNWEGAGVTPDVTTSAADALRTAHTRALRILIDRQPPGAWRETLERALRDLEGRSLDRSAAPWPSTTSNAR